MEQRCRDGGTRCESGTDEDGAKLHYRKRYFSFLCLLPFPFFPCCFLVDAAKRALHVDATIVS